MAKFRKHAKVSWKWLGRDINGVVLEIFISPVTREIKGKKIKRNGSKENPAYLVKSEAGNEALKLGSELHKRAPTSKRVVPRMFG